MPNFWPATIEFDGTEESFRVSARPKGIRGNRFASWLPFRTGDAFSVEIRVTRLSGTESTLVAVKCWLTEPDKNRYLTLESIDLSLPFKGSTVQRFLALTGEYVLGLDFVLDPAGTHAMIENRRLLSLYKFSQDSFVANLGIGLIGVLVGGGIALLTAILK